MKPENQTKQQRVLKFDTEEQAKLGSRGQVDEYKRIVYSEVYAPMRPDVDNMYMTAEDIENMAHNFLAEGLTHSIDVQHNNVLVEGARVVESFIARDGDPVFIPGAWVVGVRVLDDDIWQDILDGKINGFSVEAIVFLEESEVRLADTENTIVGHTSIDLGHSHKFVALYDENGTLIGGETDTVEGHMHYIAVSTLTRKAAKDGILHHHTFASVENLVLEEVEPSI